ncbi:hypothetical protein G2W53_023560 [Senna tora]|uniref:Uncharacterized protein n=1 Tax=Senna tora TaxID=362788 RepID=A0A834WCB6_9FABA|nr:hypothetical protein G2W53_023560 [Senna tora]
MASILLLMESFIRCSHYELVERKNEKRKEENGVMMKANKQRKAESSMDELDCFWSCNEETKPWKLAEFGVWP